MSSGGNLAAAATLMARDRGGPSITYQVLVYPVMDSSLNTKSYERFADGYIVTQSSLRWAWEQYLLDWADGDHPYASPLRAQSLDGLPPALIITAEYDPLCEEGEAYGRRLESAGVPSWSIAIREWSTRSSALIRPLMRLAKPGARRQVLSDGGSVSASISGTIRYVVGDDLVRAGLRLTASGTGCLNSLEAFRQVRSSISSSGMSLSCASRCSWLSGQAPSEWG